MGKVTLSKDIKKTSVMLDAGGREIDRNSVLTKRILK